MSKFLRISGRVLAVLVLLPIAGLVLMQSPRVQTALGRKVVQMMQDKVDADVEVGMVSFLPFNALTLQDIVILDREPRIEGLDTVLSVHSLYTTFSLRTLLQRSGLTVHSFKLSGAVFNLGIEPGDSLGATTTNLERILKSEPDPEKTELHWGLLLKARKMELEDIRFRLVNATEEEEVPPGIIDWNHLDVLVEEAAFRNLLVADDLVTGAVDGIRLREMRSGWPVQHLSSSHVRVGKERVKIDDLLLEEPESSLDLALLQLDGPLDQYADFLNQIGITAQIRPATRFSMHTLRYLAEGLDSMTFRARLKGKVKGCVNRLSLEGIAAEDLDNKVFAQIDGTISGLPDLDRTRLDMQIKGLDFTMKGLEGFLQAWAPEARLGLEGFAPGENLNLKGEVQGLLNSLDINGNLGSQLGSVMAKVKLSNVVAPSEVIRISGGLQTHSLNLGKLLGIKELGALDLKTSLEASLHPEGPQVRIDSLHIARLNALGYDYTNLSAVGTYQGDAFNGRIIAADPNLNFLFQGLFNLSRTTRNAAYRFYASLGYADLHALHLDPRETSRVSFQASSNFIRTEKRDLLGEISIGNLLLESDTGKHPIGNIDIHAHANDNLHRIRLESGFLDGSFVGDRSIGDFVNDLQDLIVDRDLPALLEKAPKDWDGGSYQLSLKVKDAQDLLGFFTPGLYVENGTDLQLNVQKDGLVKAQLRSGRLAHYEKFIKDLVLDFDNAGGVQQAELSGSALAIAGARILNNRLVLFADDNHIGLGYTFDNGEEEDTRAELYLTGDLSRDPEGLAVSVATQPSNLYFKGNGWGLSSGEIRYKAGRVSIDRLLARHEDEILLVDGGYSPDTADTLNVQMEKFDVRLLNTILSDLPGVEGRATGKAVVISPASPMPGLLANMVCDSTRIGGERVGQLEISSLWSESDKRFNAFIRNNLDGKHTLNAEGWLQPGTQELHARAELDQLNLAYAQTFLATLFSQLEGKVSGVVTVDSKGDRLKLGSENLRVQDGLVELDYTRVPYHAEGELALDREALYFKELRLSDGEEGQGTLTGKLLLNNFDDLAVDTHVRMNNIKVLNLPNGANPIFFGTAYASGRADVTGPLNKIDLDIRARTSREGTFHLPLNRNSSDGDRELLTFTEAQEKMEEDPYEQMLTSARKKESSASNLNIHLHLRVTPEMQAYIDVDDESSLSASGNGDIEIECQTLQGSFSLGGDYNISKGNFHFSALNLVSRDFDIQEGSTIRFNGDVDNTDLNVTGLYTTKASLANLISDENAVNRRNVVCGIHITGRLQNPEVDFSIEIPDLNPSTKAMVDGALNTQDKVQKQFIYLLIAGNFLPSEESGISQGGSDVLFSNVSSIMSGQLNNIFQKLDIPLDLGLNYQSTQMGTNLFDVALSTQLFNNRVIVNGSVGNKQQYGSSSANQVAGDLDIEIKLNRSGSLRLNFFTHSADDLTSYLDNSQRHGGGITFQREFDSVGEFFRNLFRAKKRQQEQAERNYRDLTRQTTLQIDSTGKATPIHVER